MLYFSKLKLVTIYFIILFLSFFSAVNFLDLNNNLLKNKQINLGLDLQGGTYLLLEVDSSPLIEQKLQNKLLSLRKILKSKKIKYESLKIKNDIINFKILEDEIKTFEDFFLNKNGTFNPYYSQYRSHELTHKIENN